MKSKLLFLDTNHRLSAIAGHFAKDYANENIDIKSAGLYAEPLPEWIGTVSSSVALPLYEPVAFESVSEQRFDLVVVLGSLSTERYPFSKVFRLLFTGK